MPLRYSLLRFRPDTDGAGTNSQPTTTPPATTPGQQTPPAATPPVVPAANSGQGDGGDPAWLPDRLKRAKESAISDLLKTLGLDSADDLTALVTDAKKRQDGEKTDLQKAQDALKAAQTKATQAEQRATQLDQQRIADKVSAAIVKVASDGKTRAQYPQDVVDHILKEWPDKFSQLWKNDTVDEKEALKLVEEVQKARPGWFMNGGPGSPSNQKGRVSTPGNKAEEELAKKKLFKL